jgi:hypothetical protein
VNEWVTPCLPWSPVTSLLAVMVVVEVEEGYILCGVRTEAEETVVIIEIVRPKPQLSIKNLINTSITR